MSAEKLSTEIVEDSTGPSSNETQLPRFDGMSENELKKLERRRL